MKFLLDANLSPALIGPLERAGHQAVHVVDLGLLTAADTVILRRVADDGYTVLTADSDFPTALALHSAAAPSVVHLRNINELSLQLWPLS